MLNDEQVGPESIMQSSADECDPGQDEMSAYTIRASAACPVLVGDRLSADQHRGLSATPAVRRSRWTRTDLNFWLDAFLLLNFLILAWVSAVIRFVFPPTTSALDWTLWSLSLDGWIGVQFGLLGTLTLGILLHIMLHWTWVCGVLSSRIRRARDGGKGTMEDGTRTILGVGLMILILNVMGLGMAAAMLSIRGPL